jgi:hypothetical protein
MVSKIKKMLTTDTSLHLKLKYINILSLPLNITQIIRGVK